MLLTLLIALTAASARDPLPAASLERLKADVYTLAQPAWEGRKAGSPGGKLAREWIIARFRALGLEPAGDGGTYEQKIWRKGELFIGKKVIGSNVLARLGEPGADGKCLMIGAHYDHLGLVKGKLYRGADDNGSGVAAMLEIARLAKENQLARRCVLFAAWDYEEGSPLTFGGIKGSKWFVEHPTFPLERIEALVNFDVLGGNFYKGAERGLYVFGTESSAVFRELLANSPRPANLKLTPFSIEVIEPLGAKVPRSDYGPFRKVGIPFLFFSAGTPKHYHRETDVPEALDYTKLTHATDAILSMLAPILDGSVTITRGEAPQWRRRADLIQAADAIMKLLREQRSNGVTEKSRARLQEDLDIVEARLTGTDAELDSCFLQIPFMDILIALNVKGTGSMKPVRTYLAWGCPSL